MWAGNSTSGARHGGICWSLRVRKKERRPQGGGREGDGFERGGEDADNRGGLEVHGGELLNVWLEASSGAPTSPEEKLWRRQPEVEEGDGAPAAEGVPGEPPRKAAEELLGGGDRKGGVRVVVLGAKELAPLFQEGGKRPPIFGAGSLCGLESY